MRLKIIAILTALAALFALPGHAANWRSVAGDASEYVEIDKDRISRNAAGQTLAWNRLVLGREMLTGTSKLTYSAVEALNRYDCANRRFATLKRIYMHDGKLVKRESVDSPRELAAAPDSVDDKLLTEACKPRNLAEARRLEESAAKAKPESEAAPQAMYADLRRSEEDRPVAVYRVEATPPPARIGLPSRAELAAAAAADKPAATPPAPAAHAAPSPPSQADTYTYVRSRTRRKKAAPAPVVIDPYSHVHWSYSGEGSPANWAKLQKEYAACASGKRQSPIDIRDSIKVDLEPIKFNYKNTQFRIIDNGHTVQVFVGAGSTITVMGRQYELMQLHFHRPAEERINGKAYDMVVHLVHEDLDHHLAVVAVLLERGSENPLIQSLWNNLPLEVGQDLAPSVAIDLNRLLPEKRDYWTYMGSLTTPPCTEDVMWMVFKQPLQVSDDQVAIFSRLYRNNTRPVQPANNRLVKESR